MASYLVRQASSDTLLFDTFKRTFVTWYDPTTDNYVCCGDVNLRNMLDLNPEH